MPHGGRTIVVSLLVVVLASCGRGEADTTSRRATQARDTALAAGLDESVAEFIATAARGAGATARVSYAAAGGRLVVTNVPPDRRVDIVAGRAPFEVRLTTDGEAWECESDGPETPVRSCERVDAFVEPVGLFTDAALADLQESLASRVDHFAFELTTRPLVGVEASCLVTTARPGAPAHFATTATLCLSPDGVLLLAAQEDELVEADAYTTSVDPALLRLHD